MADAHGRTADVQFANLETQAHAARLGMWIFLGSESLLFGALFAVYMAYRILYGHEFALAVAHNNQLLGTLNTAILITSSLTAALAVDAARSRRPKQVPWFLAATLALAAGFLLIKGVEYSAHFEDGIYPGLGYHDQELNTGGAKLFFTLYFFMTGLHALHVIGGMMAIVVVTFAHRRQAYTEHYDVPLELTVLYWHMVDAVWILLWPLFYLLQ